jgi:nudix-type nucleoside diphosphatase (YffH/AdpP family)
MEIVDSTKIHDGYLKVKEISVKSDEKTFKREVLETKNGVAALIYDTIKKKYIFVEQFRPAVDGLMLEIVAGKIDLNETPEEAIKREIMEETGYKTDTISPIKDFYTTPGTSTEIIYLFYVEVSDKVNDGGGVDDENIKIVEVEKLGLGGRLFFEDPFNMDIQPGVEKTIMSPYQLIDAKSLIAVMWREYNDTLKGVADVITNSKLRSI